MTTADVEQPLLAERERDEVETVNHATALRRELGQLHIFCIMISAVLGPGFYFGVGTVQAVGGQGPVMIALVLLGLLSASVSRDLARMLRLWPIGTGMVSFIQIFVDKELGIVAGWLYWFTQCCCFAGQMTIIGDLVDGLELGKHTSVVVTLVTVVCSILVNLTDSRYLKNIQVFHAGGKLLVAIAIVAIMLGINPIVAHSHQGHERENSGISQDKSLRGYIGMIVEAIFTLSYAFVGVEAIALLALEVDVEKPATPCMRINEENANGFLSADRFGENEEQRCVSPSKSSITDNDPFSRPAKMVPLVVTLLYIISGWIVTENFGWIDDPQPTPDRLANISRSIFIISAQDWSRRLGIAVTVFLIFIIGSTASTTLYVASRSLFGLALIHSGQRDGTANIRDGRTRLKRLFVWVSRKSKFHVPWVAVLASGLWPSILPFLKYRWPDMMEQLLRLDIAMGSTSCVMVWGLLSLAVLRFYLCLRKKQGLLKGKLPKFIFLRIQDTRWYAHPVLITLTNTISCFVIVVGGSCVTYLYNKDFWQLVPIIVNLGLFAVVVLIPKICMSIRSRGWCLRMTDLSDDDEVTKAIQSLNDERTANYVQVDKPSLKAWDCFGIVDSEWVIDKTSLRFD